jgi:uncharacterized protein
MVFSKHNIFSQIKNSENFFIVNALSGNADILAPEDALKIKALQNGGLDVPDELIHELNEKGYLVDSDLEYKLYKSKYLDFIDSRETDEVQLFFVPNYSCNFACSYCYQDEYGASSLPSPASIRKGRLSSREKEEDLLIVDAFFDYVSKTFRDRKKYITVFGGEPLLDSLKQKNIIEYLIKRSNEEKLDLCIVTNGFSLKNYINILKTGRIREIQVTLDGTRDIHNSRRFLKGGGQTFDRIVDGIDSCLKENMPINLRMVIDKDNINNLPEMSQFAIDKGWTINPKFKTQIGRNYELHHCQSAPDKLFSRISLYESLYELIKQNPNILEFHKPAFSLSKFLSESGSLPDPLFDSCPACKTEWAFDYTGHIYSCTATVGKTVEALGTFYPEVKLNNEIVKQWQRRDVFTIPECKACNLQLACGGGCGAVAKNKTGNICSTDCRPVKELLEIGFAAYF